MGARLLHFAKEWEKITQDQWILSLVREGYMIPFVQKPPLTSSPIQLTSGHPCLPEVIQALIDKGAVERVLQPGTPGFYSRVFLVPKKNGSCVLLSTFRPSIPLWT